MSLRNASASVRHQRAEEALRQSEEGLRLALEAGGMATWDWRIPTGEVIWNQNHYRMLGYETGSVKPSYQAWTDRIHPEDLAATETVLKRSMDEGGDYIAEFRVLWPSGAIHWIEARGRFERDQAGKPVRSYGVMLDVTGRKQAEEALRQSEQRERERAAELATVLDAVPAAIWIAHDPDCHHITGNRTANELLGLSSGGEASLTAPPNARPTHFKAVKDGREMSGDELPVQSAARGIRVHDIEHTLAFNNGTILHLLGNAVPLHDDQGCPRGSVAAFVNITERKQAEKALQGSEEALRLLNAELEQRVQERTAELESANRDLRQEITERRRTETALAEAAERVESERKRFNDLLETLPAYLILLTPDYHVRFANRFFRERFGESNGQRCFEYLFHRSKPCETCETFTVLMSEKPHHWYWTGPDGRNYDVFDFPFADVDGSPLIMEMGIDITEQRRAEDELKTAHRELIARAGQLRALAGELTLAEQRERRKMAKMLHDHLQQLLVGAKFRTAILGRAGDELIKNGAREIEDLLDDSISVSRSLTAELSPPILHEGGLIHGLEWLVRWMADKYGLFVDLSLEATTPPIGEDVKILLFESVRELLFNAVKHSHTRSATLNLRLVDGQLQIVVSDLGVGFETESMKPAGEPGGGFGLFSIRERLALFGGKMEMSSTPGEGSRFVLTTPLAQPTPMPPEPVAPVSEPAGAGQAVQAASLLGGGKIGVLLADDHAVMREGLAQLLSIEPDIEIIGEAADGQEAIHLASKLLPDVILMDISMPKLNGIEATRIIHNELPDIRIIGLSMFDEPEQAQAMRNAGAINYVTKSGPSTNLIAAIRRCMDEPALRSSADGKPGREARSTKQPRGQ